MRATSAPVERIFSHGGLFVHPSSPFSPLRPSSMPDDVRELNDKLDDSRPHYMYCTLVGHELLVASGVVK